MSEAKQALHFALVASIVFVASLWKGSFFLMWCGLTAFLLLNLKIQTSFFKDPLYILSVGLGLIFTLLLVFWLKFNVFLCVGIIATIFFGLLLLGYRNSIYLFPAYYFILFSVSNLTQTRSTLLKEIPAVGSALGIVVLYRVLTHFSSVASKFRQQFKSYLRALDDLQKSFFQIYINWDYLENSYSYEKKLHEKKLVLLTSEYRLRELIQHLPVTLRSSYTIKLESLITLSNQVISLGALRYRIRDFSMLEVCEEELKKATKLLSNNIKRVIKDLPPYTEQQELHSFDMLYEHTLQIVSNDPAVYLLFIECIKMTLSQLVQVHSAINKAVS